MRALAIILLTALPASAAPVPRHLFDSDLVPGYRFVWSGDRIGVIDSVIDGWYTIRVEYPITIQSGGYTYSAIDYYYSGTWTGEQIRAFIREAIARR